MNKSHLAAGREVLLSEGQIIVTKTEITGRIVYANEDFCRISAVFLWMNWSANRITLSVIRICRPRSSRNLGHAEARQAMEWSGEKPL